MKTNLPQTNARIADAVRALRVASQKLGLVADAFDHRHKDHFDFNWLLEAQYAAQTFAALLDKRHRPTAPTMPMAVFRELLAFRNRDSEEIPHTHGAVMSLMLADRCLTRALDSADQLGYAEVDPDFQTAFAARGVVCTYLAAFDSATYPFDQEELLDAILAWSPDPCGAAAA